MLHGMRAYMCLRHGVSVIHVCACKMCLYIHAVCKCNVWPFMDLHSCQNLHKQIAQRCLGCTYTGSVKFMYEQVTALYGQ